MLGRKEHELKTAQEIQGRLENRPFYLRNYYKTIYNKSYTTQNSYLRTICWFIDYIQGEFGIDTDDIKSFNKVKPFMIDNYIETIKGLSCSSQRSRLYAIKSFFKYLKKNMYIDVDPASEANMPQDNDVHMIVSLTKDEIETIKNNIFTNCGKGKSDDRWLYRDYAIVMVALSMAFRVTSITEINLEDIDLEERRIMITQKGNKTLSFVFSGQLKEVLLKWIEYRAELVQEMGVESNALFINCYGNRISVRSIQLMTKKYTYNIDKNITPHKFRSTCATEMYKKTGDIYAVSRKLGQSNIQNTKRYIQTDRAAEEKAASIMDDIIF